MFPRSRALTLLARTVFLLLAAAAPALAQKNPPHPPPPTPPGLIYYGYNGSRWSMKADGTAKTWIFTPPSDGGTSLSGPSSRTYSNGARWYLRVEQPDPANGYEEVFAYRNLPGGQLQKIRVAVDGTFGSALDK